MSKDIRSFFIVKPKPNADLSSKKSLSKLGQKKRPILIDSDSDEESCPLDAKRCKQSIEVSVKKKDNDKKSKVPETKSKYFEFDDVSVKDMFSNTPVKRDTSRRIIKRVVTKEDKDKESHFDQEFEAELAQLKDTWSDETTAEKSTASEKKEDKVEGYINGIKESPKKINGGVEDIVRKSPRKKKCDMDYSESPKKFKSESILNSPEDKNKNKLPSTDDCKANSPLKHDLSDKSSPKKSPSKTSQLNKSPLKKNKQKSPQKTPFKKLSIFRESKNKSECEVTKLKNDLSDNNNSSTQKFGVTTNTPKKDLPENKVNENCSVDTFYKKRENKKNSTANETSDSSIKKKDFSVKDEISDKPAKRDLPAAEKVAKTPSGPSNLWVERYKPTTTKQIIGQQGEKSCVNKLITWLKNWDKNQSGAKKAAKPNWGKNDDGSFFKAALLSGPPGVGKTTTAHLVCKELGFDIVEFNASDTRSKRLLHEEVSELLSTKSLSPFFTGAGDRVTKKHVLLMDEVDGMAGNEDRGGVQELITLIKQARVPVVCMCNDRGHPKIRSLANHCFDLRFSKPRVEQIRGAMMSICFKEKLKLKPDELADIITSANQDIRLIMNHLSMLAAEKTGLAHSTKHIKLGPWDITKKIFSEQDHKTMSINDKCDLFFHDYSVTPLFVQENYLHAVPHKPEAKNKIKKMELFAEAARSLSLGDLTEKSIRSNNAWGLLPVQAVFSSLVPGEVLEGHIGAQINFPAWFGKNSRQTKMSRLVQELTVHSRLKTSGNREAMNLDYLTSLGSAIVTPLVRDGADGVSLALAVLAEYCLVREDMDSIAELSTWPGCRNQFTDIESKVKAAFTRAYNKTSAPTPYAAVPVKKGRGEVDAEAVREEVEDETATQDVEEEEEDSLETDAMIMVKKKTAGKKAEKDIQPSTSKGSKTSKRGKKK